MDLKQKIDQADVYEHDGRQYKICSKGGNVFTVISGFNDRVDIGHNMVQPTDKFYKYVLEEIK